MKTISLQNADLRWHEDTKEIFVVDRQAHLKKRDTRPYTDNLGASEAVYSTHFSPSEQTAYLLAGLIAACITSDIPLEHGVKALRQVESMDSLFNAVTLYPDA